MRRIWCGSTHVRGLDGSALPPLTFPSLPLPLSNLECLHRYDDDLKGTLSRPDLAKALRELKADIDEEELARLCARFQSQGRVAYVELLHSLRPSGEGLWEVEEDLRWMIRRRFAYFTPGKLRDPFRHFSLGKKRYFSEADFSDGMRALGFKLPVEEERLLFAKLDLDCRGKVSYPAFVTWVRDPNYADVEGKLTKRFKKLALGLKEVRRVIEAERRGEEEEEEEDGEGGKKEGPRLSYRAFRKALDKLGLDLPTKDADRIAAR